MHGGEHAFRQAAGGLDGLAEEQAVFNVGDIPCHSGFFKQGLQLLPEGLFLAFGVVVEARSGGTTVAVQLFHHALHQQFAGRGGVGFAFRNVVGAGLVEDVHTE